MADQPYMTEQQKQAMQLSPTELHRLAVEAEQRRLAEQRFEQQLLGGILVMAGLSGTQQGVRELSQVEHKGTMFDIMAGAFTSFFGPDVAQGPSAPSPQQQKYGMNGPAPLM